MKEIREALPSLIERARKNEPAAFRELYRDWRPTVSRLLEGFAQLEVDEREDLVQEVFTRAFKSLDGLKAPAAFEGWLLTIARNRALSALSRKNSRRDAAERYFSETPEQAELIPEAVHAELDAEIVRAVIAKLPEGPEKETVKLFYIEGELSAREIAERMNVGKSAVTMRLERFRARIRRDLTLELLKRRWTP